MTVTVTEAFTLPNGTKVKRGDALFDTDAELALAHPLNRRRVVVVGKPEALDHLREQPAIALPAPAEKAEPVTLTRTADKTSS